MKKVVVMFLFILCFVFVTTGCSSSLERMVENNMSDIRINYFTGENEEYYVNLSCGYREETFAYDGVSTNKVECGVITLGFMQAKNYSQISIILNIDNVEEEVILEKSPYESVYMADINKILTKENFIKIKLKNQNNEVVLNEESQFWQIDNKQALKIAVKHFEQDLQNLHFNNKLNAECYLKVLSKKDFDKIYWFFSFVDRAGKSTNCLIDINSGELMLGNNITE